MQTRRARFDIHYVNRCKDKLMYGLVTVSLGIVRVLGSVSIERKDRFHSALRRVSTILYGKTVGEKWRT